MGPYPLVGRPRLGSLRPHRPAALLQRRQRLRPGRGHQLRLDRGAIPGGGDDRAGLGHRQLPRTQRLGGGRQVIEATGRLQRLDRRADRRPAGGGHQVRRRASTPALPGPGHLHLAGGQGLARRHQPLHLPEQLQRPNRSLAVEARRLEARHDRPQCRCDPYQSTAFPLIRHALMLSNVRSYVKPTGGPAAPSGNRGAASRIRYRDPDEILDELVPEITGSTNEPTRSTNGWRPTCRMHRRTSFGWDLGPARPSSGGPA